MISINRRKTRLFGSSALVRLASISALFAMPLFGMGAAQAQTLPTGGSLAAGTAALSTTPGTLTVTQTSQNAVLNWQSFSIGQGGSVVFNQPNSSAVALNRVVGADPSAILGNLSANGKVFLVNPNGIMFGRGASVNVGGLVASTLSITDADFMAGRYAFSGNGGTVLNEGEIEADGGYVALLGARVDNQAVIRANMGTVALAAGNAITLDVAGDGLLNVAINEGAVNALVQNGGLVQANGGQVLMTAQAAGALLRTAVNNIGVVEARSMGSRDGRIMLLGDMGSGTVTVEGVLDASAPSGGNGGFIETSAAHVSISDQARIDTSASSGTTGTWLIDPADFIVGAGGNISGATLSAQLVTNNVVISTIPLSGDLTGGNGDIFINDPIAWTASGTPTTLTLNAFRDVNINQAISATKGNIVVCCGRDVNVNAPLTTVNGSISLSGGRDIRVFHALTTTDGNIRLCAGHDVHIEDAVTLTRGSTIPSQSLGLPVGLTIIAGADGSGPGASGGTLIYAPLTARTTVTVAPARIYYNPVSYAAPTDYLSNFVLTEGASLDQRMLLFPSVTKAFDGTTAAVLSGFNSTALSGLPAGVSLVAGSGATAVFDQSAPGTVIGVTYSGYGLSGANAGRYALADGCCVVGSRTTGSITATSGPTPVTTLTPTPIILVPSPTPTAIVPGSTPGVTITPIALVPGLTPGVTPTPFVPVPDIDGSPTDRAVWVNGVMSWESNVTGWDDAPASDVGYAIAEQGIRMPDTQLASLEDSRGPLVEQPVDSVARPEDEAPVAPAVPVYPRKPARN